MSRDQEEVSDKNFPDYEKLFKKRKLLDLLVPRLSEVYNPERNLAVDETLVKFKGKIYFPHFFSITPARFGIKCFTPAESSSGYVLVSKIYTGKGQGVQGKDLGRRVVIDLMEKFLDKGYVLFVANYYSSVPLFQELSSVFPSTARGSSVSKLLIIWHSVMPVPVSTSISRSSG